MSYQYYMDAWDPLTLEDNKGSLAIRMHVFVYMHTCIKKYMQLFNKRDVQIHTFSLFLISIYTTSS